MSAFGIEGRVDRSNSMVMRELAQDLAATWDPRNHPDEVSSWMSRPAILRRVASALGESVHAEVDRIVATGPGAIALGSALSLTTGLPYFAVTEGDGFGSLHDGEIVVVVSATSDGAGAEYPWTPPSSTITVDCRLTVVAAGGPDNATTDRLTLFFLDPDGDMLVSERNSQ